MKEKIYKLFHPNKKIIFVGFFFIVASLIYLICYKKFGSPVSYVLYLLMSYFLVVIIIKIYQILKKIINRVVSNNKYLYKYKNDYKLKFKVSLYSSLILNILYALFKLTFGIVYKSLWFISFAFYYILLVVVRTSIVRENLKKELTIKDEYLKYRKCAILLLFMNIVLTIIILVVVNQKIMISYKDYISIAMAVYTFYIAIYSIISLIKYRKLKSPLMSASKVVNIVTSLISMLSLEVVMLSTFGEKNIVFNEIMIMFTGIGMSVILFAICIYMIIKSTEWLQSN